MSELSAAPAPSTASPPWTPLALLGHRFTANLAALATRDASLAAALSAVQPTCDYFLRPANGSIGLGASPHGEPGAITALPHPLPATAVRGLLAQLFPQGVCNEPVALAGEDVGWLWNGAYGVPCRVDHLPGYRPPLFLLIRSLERLWAILHVHDWRTLLADRRVRLFAGEDAVDQFRRGLVDDEQCPWPRCVLRADHALWPADLSIDSIRTNAAAHVQPRYDDLIRRAAASSASAANPLALAARLCSGKPLNILGITSRYTTVLQYSMRDWLATLQRLGHRTRLLIEAHDHEIPGPLTLVRACAEFQPDMVICIDHWRKTVGPIPPHIPTVMWVQDRMPHIYSRETGPAQGPRDYVIGYDMQNLTQRFGYPAARFMPAMVGVEPARFADRAPTSAELSNFGCQVSFVSNWSTPAEQILQEEMARMNSAQGRQLLDEIYQRLLAIYGAGGCVSGEQAIRRIVMQAMRDCSVTGDADALVAIIEQRINSALFRHQAIGWIADMDIDLRLYGRGWETHPRFARFARGVADNVRDLPSIFRASTINLQLIPFNAVHQRMLEGLACGGFFLFRSTAGDAAEMGRRDLWHWCRQHGVKTGPELLSRADSAARQWLHEVHASGGEDAAADPDFFHAGLVEAAAMDFTRAASTLWPQYPKVAFTTRQQLTDRISYFLSAQAADERREIAAAMRQRVLQTHTYESVSRRLLKFIADDLAMPPTAAAA